MTVEPKGTHSTPLIGVADVARSIRFYERLGFTLIDTEGPDDCPGWARLHCEGGAIMLLALEEPPAPRAQNVRFYLYTPDLAGMRARLVAEGLEPSAISHPPYMASGEMHLHDPDGYVVYVGHWGDAEHAEWERRLAARAARGGGSG